VRLDRLNREEHPPAICSLLRPSAICRSIAISVAVSAFVAGLLSGTKHLSLDHPGKQTHPAPHLHGLRENVGAPP